jgi:hypothetical protein
LPLAKKTAAPPLEQMIKNYRKRLDRKPEDADTHYNLALKGARVLLNLLAD